MQVAGHRGYFLRDAGVLLNQAFINYGISFLRARQYAILQPPYMMKKSVMAGVAQLEEFDEALYKVTGDGNLTTYLSIFLYIYISYHIHSVSISIYTHLFLILVVYFCFIQLKFKLKLTVFN